MCACGEIFYTIYTKFKNRNKRQCNECGNENRKRNKKKSHETFVKEIKELTNGEFLVRGKYKGDTVPISMYHVPCNREIMLVPSSILQAAKTGGGCSECSFERISREMTLTNEEFLDRLEELVEDEYSALEEYTKSIESILFIHNMCGEVFPMSPNSFFSGHRCPTCAYNINAEKATKTHETFIEEVEELVGEEYSVLGKYARSNIRIEMRHNICGEVYKVTPAKFLQGGRCTKCRVSKGVRTIIQHLEKHGIEFTLEKRFKDCRNKLPLPFDFYVEGQLLIEYDGDFHFVPARFSKDKTKMKKKLLQMQSNDRIKNSYCIDRGIPFARIPCWEVESSERILKNILMYFNIIEKDDTFDEHCAKRFIVDSNWNHDVYINEYRRTYWLEGGRINDTTG